MRLALLFEFKVGSHRIVSQLDRHQTQIPIFNPNKMSIMALVNQIKFIHFYQERKENWETLTKVQCVYRYRSTGHFLSMKIDLKRCRHSKFPTTTNMQYLNKIKTCAKCWVVVCFVVASNTINSRITLGEKKKENKVLNAEAGYRFIEIHASLIRYVLKLFASRLECKHQNAYTLTSIICLWVFGLFYFIGFRMCPYILVKRKPAYMRCYAVFFSSIPYGH